MAWAGYALTYYLQARALENPQFSSQDPLGIQFRGSAEAIARWLLARQVPAGPTEISSAAEVEWVSTEHNIDAWYFLRDLGRLMGEARYADAAERIRERLLTLWSEKDGQFL